MDLRRPSDCGGYLLIFFSHCPLVSVVPINVVEQCIPTIPLNQHLMAHLSICSGTTSFPAFFPISCAWFSISHASSSTYISLPSATLPHPPRRRRRRFFRNLPPFILKHLLNPCHHVCCHAIFQCRAVIGRVWAGDADVAVDDYGRAVPLAWETANCVVSFRSWLRGLYNRNVYVSRSNRTLNRQDKTRQDIRSMNSIKNLLPLLTHALSSRGIFLSNLPDRSIFFCF